MKKRSSVSNSCVSIDKDGFVIEFPSVETRDLALELALLDMGLCDEFSLILPQYVLKLIKNSRVTLPSAPANFSIVEDRISLELNEVQIGYLTHFVLQIYRDGSPPVNHIDLEAVKEGTPFEVTFFFQEWEQPMS